MYYQKNVDYVYILWEDLVYRIKNKVSKKNKGMYYPRFTKVIINHFMSKAQSIPRRKKVDWHMAKDDPILTIIRYISKHEVVQKYDAILPDTLTNQEIKNSDTYKTYYAFASRKEILKPKYVRPSTREKTDQPPKASPAKGLQTLSEVALSEAEQIKLATKRSKKDFYMSHVSGSGDRVDFQSKVPNEQHQKTFSQDEDDADEETNVNDDSEETESDKDGDDLTHPKLSTYKADDEEEEEKQMMMKLRKVKRKKKEEEELYGDLNINLQRSDAQMTDAQQENIQANQVTEDTHVDSAMKTIIKEQVQAQVSKIMQKIKKYVTESLRAEVLKNLYNALVESYNSDKDIFSSYGDVVTLKRGINDQDKDEASSVGSNQGSKRRRSGKEAKSSKELTHKESKSTSSSKDASKYQPKSTGKFAHAEEHGGSLSQKYTTFVTMTKAADYGQVKWIEDKRFYGYASNMESSYDVYSRYKIIAVTSLKIMEWFGYSHLEEIIVRRHDDKLYKFREGDFKRLQRQDIKDMLLLLIQDKLSNLNLKELDGTLNHVRTALNDIATGIEMDYSPKQK
uniref:Uncharacterized protein n=1 Tax=Tanacetum cinerariifolium TaxID=118510 RepID=A0A699HKK1_TANCI|nr:hypothetical protein [Tanacetum cinerariifolium]